MGFDKFVWIKTLAADPDPRLTNSDKFILSYAALVNVQGGEHTLCVRQATLAGNCATTDRQVGRAFSAGKECGYLVLVQERQRGRGHTRADEYRLAFPRKIPDKSSAINAEIPDSLSGIDGEIPDNFVGNTGQNGQEYRTNPTVIPDNFVGNIASTSDDESPKGFTKGFSQGFAPEEDPTQEQEHAPDGAGQDEKKERPQLPGMVHGVLKSTNIALAGSPPPPQRNGPVPDNGVVAEKLDPWVERVAGFSDCELCDDDGYLPDDTQCWHGKTPAA